MHRVLIDQLPMAGELFRVEGDEARHAVRVKRLAPGEKVELLDGRGGVALASVHGAEKLARTGEWTLLLDVASVERRDPIGPRIEVLAPAPKGDRLEEMIDGLSQVGAASWRPLDCARAVSETRERRVERLNRVARESAKQCGRPWAIELDDAIGFEQAMASTGGALIEHESQRALARVVLADAGGQRFAREAMAGPGRADVGVIRLLIGPEGGWDDRERAIAARAGVLTCSFGPHVMRIEQAAVVAAAIVLHELRAEAR